MMIDQAVNSVKRSQKFNRPFTAGFPGRNSVSPKPRILLVESTPFSHAQHEEEVKRKNSAPYQFPQRPLPRAPTKMNALLRMRKELTATKSPPPTTSPEPHHLTTSDLRKLLKEIAPLMNKHGGDGKQTKSVATMQTAVSEIDLNRRNSITMHNSQLTININDVARDESPREGEIEDNHNQNYISSLQEIERPNFKLDLENKKVNLHLRLSDVGKARPKVLNLFEQSNQHFSDQKVNKNFMIHHATTSPMHSSENAVQSRTKMMGRPQSAMVTSAAAKTLSGAVTAEKTLKKIVESQQNEKQRVATEHNVNQLIASEPSKKNLHLTEESATPTGFSPIPSILGKSTSSMGFRSQYIKYKVNHEIRRTRSPKAGPGVFDKDIPYDPLTQQEIKTFIKNGSHPISPNPTSKKEYFLSPQHRSPSKEMAVNSVESTTIHDDVRKPIFRSNQTFDVSKFYQIKNTRPSSAALSVQATKISFSKRERQTVTTSLYRKQNTIFFAARLGIQSINSSCLLYTSPSPRDGLLSRMPSSA
eukprot:TRINITY_DN1583_c0_g2_i6.p1 TRINITY_DN1583_c0_g2~~TRINITY_DN1583_c0_g2_i6.p1  ORF type:complete len:531 (-),score=59.17 TRINITY_DN1583_c0_g2_i6:25-1617(-)